MKITENYRIWEDDQNVYGQRVNFEVNSEYHSPGPRELASHIIYTMNKNFEKAMLKKLNREQLENIRQLVDEVLLEVEDAEDITACNEALNKAETTETKGPVYNETLQFPTFKSYGLTKDQVQEVMENYINYQYSKSIERLRVADEPYKRDLEIKLLQMLVQVKDMYCVLYTHI